MNHKGHKLLFNTNLTQKIRVREFAVPLVPYTVCKSIVLQNENEG